MVLKITLHKGTLMLKKNIILAFLLFNLLNYSSQLFAGAGEGIAAMVGHNDYSTWNNDHKLAFRDDDGEIAAGHPLQNTELHYACNDHSILLDNTGNEPQVILGMLIANDCEADPSASRRHKNMQNFNGNTPLHEFCSHDLSDDESTTLTSDEIARLVLLLITPENINMPNNQGNTPLHLACMHGYQYITEALMKNKSAPPNVHAKNSLGHTPLDCLPATEETFAETREAIIRIMQSNMVSRRPIGK